MGVSPMQSFLESAPQWILNLPENIKEIFYLIYKCFIFKDRYEMFLEGWVNTLTLTARALLLGIILGIVVALIRASWDKNHTHMRGIVKFFMGIGNAVCKVYVTVIRGGIMSVDPGQMEAGRSLGFGYVATMWHIVLPQAFKAILPALANEFIVLLKETAVAGYVAVMDLTYAGNTVGGVAFEYLFPLLMTAIIYLVMVMFFTSLVQKLERRLRNSER